MTNYTFLTVFAIVTLSAVLTACDSTQDKNNRISESLSRTLTPSNTELAAIYNRSCKNCHTVASTRSPLTGDSKAWAQRMDKGMDTLLDNVVNGFAGMPPLGLCMDCDMEHFEALIKFMAQPVN